MEHVHFQVGNVYDRQRDIHRFFKGQKQGGISTPSASPFVFLFTGEAGEQYGYEDHWTKDGAFLYTGEGQIGDMKFVRGNKAIRDHAATGRDLLLFKSLGKGKGYGFVGQFDCTSWEKRPGRDKLGNRRQVIVFHLIPHITDVPATAVPRPAPRMPSLEKLRQKALEAARGASEQSPRTGRRSYYERSEDVKNYVLARAAGTCEACKKPAPFTRVNGEPYLEPHHTRRLSDGGPDDARWVAAVCPNCHKQVHYGAQGEELNKRIQTYLRQIESPAEPSTKN